MKEEWKAGELVPIRFPRWESAQDPCGTSFRPSCPAGGARVHVRKSKGLPMIKDQMEKIYRSIPPEEIPWNMETPPDAIQELVRTEKIRPCRVIDLGCGTGNTILYLSRAGFDATGVDISPAAIEMAKKSASAREVKCEFLVADVLGDMAEIRGTFDFAYDWELLHHIFPPDRERYAKNVHRLLNREGWYLSVCFSEESPQFGGAWKYRKTRLGTVLYFSSEREVAALFEPLFEIEELKTIDIQAKFATHKAIYALMRKTR
jgi:SAM-dependent methyltransferase